ncbi:serine/threonine-protein kinase [Hyalangium sp.]|uniref:serine/threonine-protein kinase n=1 Tax=Hyalangium sp. TaxID=2028555 RepID=UPI002D58D056|nr:serine/threonine-protein kinase [Hyalangium sp.]HYH96210.1 serine/threonine-protein kinase [Hyalangium sp.]
MTALAPLEIPPGTDVRGFLIEGKLGAGGFGTVYRARRGERLYALKFIRIKDAGGWAKREVESLLRVSHRNVVGFEGCGFWPEETHEYLVVIMDYVEGRRLDVWADEENPDAREVTQKVLGVGRALVAIHQENVIHRDLKEANIIVRASNGDVVVVDFGVAGGPHTARVTRDVLPPCTLEYRSPEAWRFLRENVRRLDVHYQPGPRDDLYALGVVLYWLLTGRYPCVGVTEAEQAEVTIHQVPEPPHVVNPRVPEAISAICMRLLEKQPENRYPDAAALCATVEMALAIADAAWSVPLCDAHAPDNVTTVGDLARVDGDDGVDHWLREARHEHERPRRGRWPVPAAPEGKPLLPAAVEVAPAVQLEPPAAAPPVEPPGKVEVKGGPPGLVSSSRVRHPIRAGALSIPLLGTAALVFVLGLTMAVVQLHPRPATSPPAAVMATEEPRARIFEVVPETTWEVGEIGWKVASPMKSPEADRDNVLSVAEASVKNPQQKQQKVLAPVAKAISTGAACLTMACTGPQVRPEPPAEPCPSGAVEAMEKLGIKVGDRGDATFPVNGDPRPITVKEGGISVRLYGRWGELPQNTLLFGKLSFGRERVYGRFTQAQLPKGGGTVRVCAELVEAITGKPGEPMWSRSTADDVKIGSVATVRAVDRFE